MEKIILSVEHIDELKHIQNKMKEYSKSAVMEIFETNDPKLGRTCYKTAQYIFSIEDMMNIIIENNNDITLESLVNLSESIFMLACVENIKTHLKGSDKSETSDMLLNISLKIDKIVKAYC